MENSQKTASCTSSEENHQTSRPAPLNNLMKEDVQQKLELIHQYYYEGRFSLAIQSYQEILAGISKEEQETLRFRGSLVFYKLGLAYFENFDYQKAHDYFMKAYDLEKISINPNFLEVASIMIDIGRVYFSQSKYNEAMSKYQESQELIKKVAGKDAKQLIALLGQLKQGQGKYQEALVSLEEANRIIHLQDPLETSEIGHNYSIRGWLYYSLGENTKAIEFAKNSLEIKEKLYGKNNHPAIALDYNCLGNAFIVEGKVDKALDCFTQALNIRLEFFGGANVSTASCFNNIAIVQHRLKNYDSALQNFEKCLKARVEVFGMYHADVAISYNNVGAVFHSRGMYEEALKNYNLALDISIKVLGPHHPSMIMKYNNIGLVNRIRGNQDLALIAFKKALSISLIHSLNNHPDTATTYYNMGTIYHRKKEFQHGLENVRKALGIRQNLFGNNHRETHFCYSLMNQIFSAIKDHSCARSCLLKSRKTLMEIEGKDINWNIQQLAFVEKRNSSLDHNQGDLL